MSIPTQPPNEGTTQFVYQYTDGNFYMVDYAANTVSSWNNDSQAFINKGGSLQAFVNQLQAQAYQAWIAALVTSNAQPAVTDYFGNADNNIPVNSGGVVQASEMGQIATAAQIDL
jgi:hypothetical protein